MLPVGGLACVAFEFFKWDIKQFRHEIKGFWVEVINIPEGMDHLVFTIIINYHFYFFH